MLDPFTYDKAIKFLASLSTFVKGTGNDASIGLYRIQEHIMKRSLTVIAEKNKLVTVKTELELKQSDTKDAIDSIPAWKAALESMRLSAMYANKALEEQTKRQRPQKKLISQMSGILKK